MAFTVWFIDEEWKDYDVETAEFKRAFPDCTIIHSGNDFKKDLHKYGPEADAILAQIYVDMDREAIGQLKKCKVIAVWGGGYDRVDTEAAEERGITVTFVPSYCVDDVSDYVIAAVYRYARRTDLPHIEGLADGLWGYQALLEMPQRIAGSTMSIVGLGRIGSAVARKAAAIGMKVVANDPYVSADEMAELGVKKVELDECLREADFLSLNMKLTPETEGIISDEKLGLLKPSCCIINTARGQVIDEPALIRRIKCGKIGAAYLDVIAHEPAESGDPVLKCPRIYVTPHISYLSHEALTELKTRTAGNAIKVLRGEEVEDKADH
jgi:D-3-phosphoglycerate dehydrogenase